MPAGVGWAGIFLLTIGSLTVFNGLKRPGALGRAQGLGAGLVLVVAGTLCLGLFLALRGFEAFAREELVAEVTCRRLSPQEFEVGYAPAVKGSLAAPSVFRLRGDQWTVSGGVVKWHPWLTVTGLASRHKPTRLSGRFASAEDERARPPTVIELNGGEDAAWDWFYRLDPWLPFVEAAYGSAAYAPADPSRRFQVFISPSGYLIKSARRSHGGF